MHMCGMFVFACGVCVFPFPLLRGFAEPFVLVCHLTPASSKQRFFSCVNLIGLCEELAPDSGLVSVVH